MVPYPVACFLVPAISTAVTAVGVDANMKVLSVRLVVLWPVVSVM